MEHPSYTNGGIPKIIHQTWKTTEIPEKWKKKSVLVSGTYVDSHILFFEDTYYLFTTRKIKLESGSIEQYDYELCLFFSDSLNTTFEPHPKNPIRTGRKYARSGGPIVLKNGKIYRIAQDCTNIYGRELHFFQINVDLILSKIF
jgi:hypothetical protein